jgi:hypothetical protein
MTKLSKRDAVRYHHVVILSVITVGMSATERPNGFKLTGANPHAKNYSACDAASCGFASGAATSWAAPLWVERLQPQNVVLLVQIQHEAHAGCEDLLKLIAKLVDLLDSVSPGAIRGFPIRSLRYPAPWRSR